MFKDLQHRRYFIIFGTLFGAWLGGIYAFWSQAVNWVALPGIPLTPPGNGLPQYIVQYILVGALMGLITSLPHASAAGITLGGFLGALAVSGLAIRNEWGKEDFLRSFILLLYTFFPLVVLFLPIAFMVRRGTDAQEVERGQPELWARRVIIPMMLTLVIVVIGSFSLHDGDVRGAIRYMDTLIKESRQAPDAEGLARPLLDVKDYYPNANQPYSLAWSDKVETFFGPRPATGEMSQFLIIATFENGFRFACVFSRTTNVPNCTNY